ncbi:hypothetical protein J4423_00030 [Candidatus Pacearchaeota archaeon]|nr:hypothetical protein [Candidatus Pacearchaeota archaeon]
MRLRVMIVLFALALFLLPLVSSSIFIEPLNEVYNYGDTLIAQTKIVPSVATSGHYTVDLKCGNITINVFNNFLELSANVEREVTVMTQVLNPLLNNITSSCLLRASFSGESINSNSFALSNKINVEAEIEFDELKPSNSLIIGGTAIKESGVPLNGFVELFINSLNLYKSFTVTEGIFNMSLMLPADVKSGKHNVTLEIHNTDSSSRKINFGSFTNTFTVLQVLKNFEIVIDNENVNPGTDFVFRVDAVDQAGDDINKDVSISINDPKGIPYVKKIIKSKESQVLKFSLNNTPGYWNVEADVDGNLKRKLFYLLEVQELQVSLINDTLLVTNIGNSPYDGPLEVTIGSFVEIKQVKLGVGEMQRFTLRAPDGDYSISIMEDGLTQMLGSTFLTGNAVKVTNFREDLLYTIANPIIWWLAVIFLVLIIIFVQMRIRKTHRSHIGTTTPTPAFSANSKPKEAVENKPVADDVVEKKLTFDFSRKDDISIGKSTKFDNSWMPKLKNIDFSPPKNVVTSQQNPIPKIVPSTLFASQNQGIRERAVAIALYVNNQSTNITQTLNGALSVAKEAGAKIYIDGEYKIILFSPKLTNNIDNESVAVSVGRRIQALFLEHVKNNNDGVLFGIGVSNGEIISEVENDKFHFTSTGNLISLAKRIAQSSNMKLFISDSVRRKVISNVKTDRSPFQNVWEVTRVIDHSQSRDFIKRFSDRNR